jgi:hypothetical protein
MIQSQSAAAAVAVDRSEGKTAELIIYSIQLAR